jgi:hypothetical protein
VQVFELFELHALFVKHCRTVFGTKTNMVHLYHIRPNMVQMYHIRTEYGTIFDRIWYKHCTIFGWNKFFYARQNVFGTYQKKLIKWKWPTYMVHKLCIS